MGDFYGLDGEPITMEQWGGLYENDENDSRRIGLTEFPGGVWISTVHLGIDHQFGDGPPLIFETMVFGPEEGYAQELDMERYSTKEQAAEGHQRMVTKWTGWTPGDPEPEED